MITRFRFDSVFVLAPESIVEWLYVFAGAVRRSYSMAHTLKSKSWIKKNLTVQSDLNCVLPNFDCVFSFLFVTIAPQCAADILHLC